MMIKPLRQRKMSIPSQIHEEDIDKREKYLKCIK